MGGMKSIENKKQNACCQLVQINLLRAAKENNFKKYSAKSSAYCVYNASKQKVSFISGLKGKLMRILQILDGNDGKNF